MTSPPETSSGFGVARVIAGVRCPPAHIHQVGAGTPLTELWHWFTFVAPSRLACRTWAVWQCRPVTALSGLLSTLTRIPGIRLPSGSPACCDRPAIESFHLHSVTRRASWRARSSAYLINTGEPAIAHPAALPVVW